MTSNTNFKDGPVKIFLIIMDYMSFLKEKKIKVRFHIRIRTFHTKNDRPNYNL